MGFCKLLTTGQGPTLNYPLNSPQDWKYAAVRGPQNSGEPGSALTHPIPASSHCWQDILAFGDDLLFVPLGQPPQSSHFLARAKGYKVFSVSTIPGR